MGKDTLYTIGYGGRSPAQVAALLTEHKISVLVDVRASPLSRIPAYNKNTLSHYLDGWSITYHHIQALGNANRNAGADAPIHLEDEALGLEELRHVLETWPRPADHPYVAIMCAERDHRGCHRTYIAERLPECTVVHL